MIKTLIKTIKGDITKITDAQAIGECRFTFPL